MTEPAATLVSQAVSSVKKLGKDGALVLATVLQNVDVRPLPAAFPANDPNLCAALLVIEIQACRDPGFVEVLEWAIQETAERDDFRLLPYLHGCTFEEFRDHLAPQHQHIADDLPDSVQISHSHDLDQVHADLCKYAAQLHEIRDQSEWRDVCNTVALRLGRIAIPIQCCAVVLAFGAALSVGASPVGELLQPGKPLTGVVVGIALFSELIAAAYFIDRIRSVSNATSRKAGMLASKSLGLLAIPAYAIAAKTGVSSAWIAVGLFAGATADVARRRAWQARRMLRKFDASVITQAGALPEELSQKAILGLLPGLSCPIMPETIPRVFVSYARCSNWSVGVARRLSESLSAADARCFVDTQHIVEGVNWRRQLNVALGQANMFIALVDSQTVQRPWPAAEMETALHGKKLTGLPEILVITSPEMPSDRSNLKCLPVFEAVLAARFPSRFEGQLKVIRFSEATVSALARQLRPGTYQSIGLVSPGIARRLRALWHVPHSVISAVGKTLGKIAGHAAMLLSVIEWISRSPGVPGRFKFSSASILESHALLMLSVLFSSVLLGYLARMSAASRFDLRVRKAIGSYKAHRDATVGLLAIILTWAWSGRVPSLGWAFAGISILTGWQAADSFLVGIRNISAIRSAG